MVHGWVAPGVNHVPEYLVSGVPWVTGSLAVPETETVRIGFPNVTKFFTVRNSGANDVRVGFTRNGISGSAASKYFVVTGSGGETKFDLRVRDLFLIGDGGATTVDVLGGLTAIPRRFYQPLTGANPPPSGSWFVPGIE